MVGLVSMLMAITLALFCGVGYFTQGWGPFVWVPAILFPTMALMFACNIFAIKSARFQVILLPMIIGIASPPIAVLFAGFVLVAFGEPIGVAAAIALSNIVLLLLLATAEAKHCDPNQVETQLRKAKHLRKLPDGREAFDTYWEWGTGAAVDVPGMRWRKWLDSAVLAFAILAMPIGAAVAFTGANNLPDVPVQWGIMTAFLVAAWLLRPLLTSVFGQLAFLTFYMERGNS